MTKARRYGLDDMGIGPLDADTGETLPRTTAHTKRKPKITQNEPSGNIQKAKKPKPQASLTGVQKREFRMGQVIAAVQAGAITLREAASAADVTSQTVSNWIRRGDLGEEPYAAFLQGYMKALQHQKSKYLERIDTASLRDWKAAAHLLDRLDTREAEADPVQQAWAGQTEEEVLEAFANHPKVIERVLATQNKTLSKGSE